MSTFYAVDSNGFFAEAVEVNEYSAIVKGSDQPPPKTQAGEKARLGFSGWVIESPEGVAEILRKASVPASISPRQFKQALTQVGKRGMVEAAVAAADQGTKDWYAEATDFQPTHPVIVSMAEALGISQTDIENLFILGGSL